MKEVEIDLKDKVTILNDAISNYKKQLYSLQIQYEAADITENEQAKSEISKAIESNLKITKFLQDKLHSVTNKGSDDNG
jgi:hypothetical protein